MGFLGYGLYFLVQPILGDRIDELHGDAMWPSTILAGMAWSLAFLLAGWLTQYLHKPPSFLFYFTYLLILWLWILVVWFTIIHFKVVN